MSARNPSMHNSEPVRRPRRSVFYRVVRVTVKIIFTVFALLIVLVLLIQVPYVQDIIRGRAEKYLSRKLNTRVAIGRLYVRFPETVLLSNIYLEDRQKDTLFSAGLIHVNLRMWALLHNKVDIQELQLSGLTLKIKRQSPDTTFNFQFIADAFAGSPDKKPAEKPASEPMQISLQSLFLDKIRLVYKDGVTGDDVEIWLGHTWTKTVKFDPSASSPLQLGQLNLEQTRLDYRNTISAFYTTLRLGRLTVGVKDLDLAKRHIELKELDLDSTTASIRMGLPQTRAVSSLSPHPSSVHPGAAAPTPLAAAPPPDSSGDWRIVAASLQLKEDNFRFDDDRQPRQPRGMDYAHLKIDGLTLQANRLLYNKDSVSGMIANGRFREQSGFQLDKLQTDFLYAGNQAYLKSLELRTPGTLLRRQAVLRYSSPGAMLRDPAHYLVDLDLPDCKVQVKDILTFAPALYKQPVFSHPNEVCRINARIRGSLAALRIETLQFNGLGDTKIDLSGTLRHLTDRKRIAADLDVRNLSGSRSGLLALLPPGTLPADFSIPEQFNMQGKISGSMDSVRTDLALHSTSGSIVLKGAVRRFRDLASAGYDMDVQTTALDLGYIFHDTADLGTITAGFTAKGHGLTIKDANAVFSGQVHSAVVRKFDYHDFRFEGSIADRQAELISSIRDTAVRFSMQASADLTNRFPAIRLDWQIDTLDLHALHLVDDTLTFKGHLGADFANTDPDSLQGKLRIDSMAAVYGGHSMTTDSIVLLAERTNDIEDIRLLSEMADLDWKGRYKLTELTQALKRTINHYYRINGFADTPFTPQEWQMTLAFRPSPMVLSYMPSLKGTDTANFRLDFNSDHNDLHCSLQAPRIQIGNQVIYQAGIQASTGEKQLQYGAQMAGFSGSGLRLYQTSLYGNLANDQAQISLLVKDESGTDRYRLSGLLDKGNEGLTFRMDPDSLLLNYDKWQVSRDNFIRYDSAGLAVNDLKISNKDQALRIASDSLAPSSPDSSASPASSSSAPHSLSPDSSVSSLPPQGPPINVNFSNFRISTLSRFAGQDSLLADGVLNGKATLKNILSSPVFTSDLRINNLLYRSDSIGDLTIKVNNEHTNSFSADISLQGHQNDVRLSGDYYTGEGRIDMKLDLHRLNLDILKPFAGDQLEESKGFLLGSLSVTGTADRPVLNGRLHFDSAMIIPALSGEPLKLSNDNIDFDADGFNFSQFSLLDSAGNKATLDGNVYTADYRDYRFDLSLNAANFRLINSHPGGNRTIYGKMNLDAAINMTGDMNLPKVDGHIRINRQTDLTYVLPGNDPEVVDREGVVEFINTKAPADTLAGKPADTLHHSQFKGMEVGLNIATDSNALFTMILDETSGDALKARGRSNLVFAMGKSGKMDLTGTYEVESGSYDLSLDVLKRRFDIQRGSTITWTGDPLSAIMNITATYSVNTAPIDLVSNEIAGRSQSDITKFKQKLPFLVTLNMEGDLLKPKISFDITLPPGILSQWPDVDAKLQQIRVQESEMNKQVFALLLLNRFVGDDPLQSAAGSASVGNMAFQSASQLLTGQIDQLAASLIKGVDIHFDLNSQQDFSTGQEYDYTQLNVTVSKRLFNDRIQVNVGSNFDVQGSGNPNQNASNIAGDVTVDYKLSVDGRYMLRAFRKNQYEMAVQGQVVETGVSFILTFDYNKFKELFQKVQQEKLNAKKAGKPVSPNNTNP